MRYRTGVMVTILAVMAAVSPAHSAGEFSPPVPNADEIIASCRAMSEQLNHSARSPAEATQSAKAFPVCIENHIKENLRILADENRIIEGWTLVPPGDQKEKSQNFDGMMENMYKAVHEIYYQTYRNIKLCPTCTDDWYFAASLALARYYEDILRVVLERRKYWELKEE